MTEAPNNTNIFYWWNTMSEPVAKYLDDPSIPLKEAIVVAMKEFQRQVANGLKTFQGGPSIRREARNISEWMRRDLELSLDDFKGHPEHGTANMEQALQDYLDAVKRGRVKLYN